MRETILFRSTIHGFPPIPFEDKRNRQPLAGDGRRETWFTWNAGHRQCGPEVDGFSGSETACRADWEAGNSRLIAYNFITEVASNGNLQIKMHSFTLQDLSQR